MEHRKVRNKWLNCAGGGETDVHGGLGIGGGRLPHIFRRLDFSLRSPLFSLRTVSSTIIYRLDEDAPLLLLLLLLSSASSSAIFSIASSSAQVMNRQGRGNHLVTPNFTENAKIWGSVMKSIPPTYLDRNSLTKPVNIQTEASRICRLQPSIGKSRGQKGEKRCFQDFGDKGGAYTR